MKQHKTISKQDARVCEKNLNSTGIAEINISDRNGTYSSDARKVSAQFDQLGFTATTGFFS